MSVPDWYVLTGGPSCGKTTLIKELSLRGYHTVDEAARSVIDEHLERGITVEYLRNNKQYFQDTVTQKNIHLELNAPKDRKVFFDRSRVDNIGYCIFNGINPEPIRKISYGLFKKVFFLEQLNYKKDYARTEDEEGVIKINKLLYESYTECGYVVEKVPVLSVQERLEYILQRI